MCINTPQFYHVAHIVNKGKKAEHRMIIYFNGVYVNKHYLFSLQFLKEMNIPMFKSLLNYIPINQSLMNYYII